MNKNIIKTFLIICFLITGKAYTAPVKIIGTAPEYAQNSIDINIFHDFITEEKIKLGTIQFDSQGKFELELNLEQVSWCMADFDGYHGMIYLEPGKSYELMFPPKSTLTAAEKKNPFFKPEPVWLGIKNPENNNVNLLIQKFETAYSNYENKYFNQIFIKQSGSLIDTVKHLLDKEFPTTNNSFFESHKLFRKANLEFALHQGKSAAFMASYYSEKKPVYNLAAYADLFNQVFINYFSYLQNTNHHASISNMIKTANLQELDDYFQKQLHFNTELSHWVLLKSMKDAFYSKSFSKNSILQLLDKVKQSNWSSYERKTAQLIQEKLTYLASGTKPPFINLTDQSGNLIQLSDFPNNYIYLHFTDPSNPICRQHLDVLKSIGGRYKGNLVIINVLPSLKNFKNEAGWAGIFTTSNSNLESTYKVKTYPNSFLIGKDGKLLLSPAPNPIDGFDRQMGQILKSDHFKELQKANGPNIR